MGLRVVARHSAGRHGGRALAREVAESHRPKHLDASTRLLALRVGGAARRRPLRRVGAVRRPRSARGRLTAPPRRRAGARRPGLRAPGLGAAEHERLRRAVDVRRPAAPRARPGVDGPGREDARAVEGAARRALHRPRRPRALARRPHRRRRGHRRAGQPRGARHAGAPERLRSGRPEELGIARSAAEPAEELGTQARRPSPRRTPAPSRRSRARRPSAAHRSPGRRRAGPGVRGSRRR